MKAGILIDAWKLPIFERHLTDAFYSYEKTFDSKDENLIGLTVITEDVTALERVIRAANTEAALISSKPGPQAH